MRHVKMPVKHCWRVTFDKLFLPLSRADHNISIPVVFFFSSAGVKNKTDITDLQTDVVDY